jgi:hypothetical protein
VKELQQFFLSHGCVLDNHYLILEIYHVLELCRTVGVVCLVWATIGCILTLGVGICYSSAIGRDCIGVISGRVVLCTNGAYGFQCLTEA